MHFTLTYPPLTLLHSLISWVGCNKMPQTTCLNTTEIYCLIVPETRNRKSRCQQYWFPFESLRENLVHVSLLASGASSNAWCPLPCGCIPSISVSVTTCCSFPVCLFLCLIFPLFIRAPVIGL